MSAITGWSLLSLKADEGCELQRKSSKDLKMRIFFFVKSRMNLKAQISLFSSRSFITFLQCYQDRGTLFNVSESLLAITLICLVSALSVPVQILYGIGAPLEIRRLTFPIHNRLYCLGLLVVTWGFHSLCWRRRAVNEAWNVVGYVK